MGSPWQLAVASYNYYNSISKFQYADLIYLYIKHVLNEVEQDMRNYILRRRLVLSSHLYRSFDSQLGLFNVTQNQSSFEE